LFHLIQIPIFFKRALANIFGFKFVNIDQVRSILNKVVSHRITLISESKFTPEDVRKSLKGVEPSNILDKIILTVPTPL